MTSHSKRDGFRILVVDDHDISRNFVVAALRRSGARVKQARSAASALAVALRWLPDLVFIDYRLPDLPGDATARRIGRNWPASSGRPAFVCLSATPAPGRWPRHTRFITKPASVHQILAQLPASQAVAVGEPQPRGSLSDCFIEELENRLPELHRCLAHGRRRPARHILHQLIGSSAICGASALERASRRLDEVLDARARRSGFGPAYYRFLAAADCYLQASRDSASG